MHPCSLLIRSSMRSTQRIGIQIHIYILFISTLYVLHTHIHKYMYIFIILYIIVKEIIYNIIIIMSLRTADYADDYNPLQTNEKRHFLKQYTTPPFYTFHLPVIINNKSSINILYNYFTVLSIFYFHYYNL